MGLVLREEKKTVGIEQVCPDRERCPHLGFESTAKVMRERGILRQRIDDMERTMELATEKIVNLQQENIRLKAENRRLTEKIKEIYQKPFKKKCSSDTEEAKERIRPIRRGAPPGHRGATRKKPEHIDEYVPVYPEVCPTCDTELKPIQEKEQWMEKHIQEDLVIQKKTTCYIHHHGYCPRCKKVVSAKGKNELPRAYIGPVAKGLAAYLHYEAKVSKGSVAKTFREFFDLPLVASSLVGFDRKLYEEGVPFYEQIKEKVRWSSSIHADETGWNLDGINQWLWCFTNPQVVLYHIDPKRSSEVVKKFLGEKYGGILISDDFSAYSPVEAKAKQKCNPHFLRNIKEVLEEDLDSESKSFLEEVKGLIKNAIQSHREYRTGKKSIMELANLKEEILEELIKLCSVELKNERAENLRRRILRHGEELFTFLTYPEIEPDNNRVERQLRPNVILRKITFGHRSVQGMKNHSVAMSLIETAKLNGVTPRDFLLSLLTNGATETTSRLLFGSIEPRAQ